MSLTAMEMTALFMEETDETSLMAEMELMNYTVTLAGILLNLNKMDGEI